MEWVKQDSRYYLEPGVAMGSDALEVMHTRAKSLAGEIELSGFIPDAMLQHLTRRPGQARRLASELVKADLWERVPGGYQIVGWAEDQAELEKHVERKRRDKERKRRAREASRSSDSSTDTGADTSTDSLSWGEIETELEVVPEHGMTVTGGARPASCNAPLRGVS